MVSIIIPAFNEADNLPALVRRLNETVSTIIDHEFEFIFVDDSSSDQTFEILRNLNQTDPRVKALRFKENRGSHMAITAGLDHASGDCAVIMAADLQDPPELIIQLLNKWQEKIPIVWGVRQRREGESFGTKIFSRIYYALINVLTTVRMPPSGADVFLIDRKVIEAFNKISNRQLSVFMTVASLDFKQASLEYKKEARLSGASKWTLGRKCKLAFDSIINFNRIPLIRRLNNSNRPADYIIEAEIR